jgi:hypothetical protein
VSYDKFLIIFFKKHVKNLTGKIKKIF